MKTTTSKLFAATVALFIGMGCGPEDSFESADAEALKSSGSTTTTSKKGRTTTTTEPSTTTYALRTTDAKGGSPIWSSSFYVTSTYELFFAFDVPSTLTGHHAMAIFVKAPGGASYQRMDVKFSTDVAPAVGEIQAEKLSTGGYRVWSSMPVAGTAIEQYGLVGSWSAAAHLDGSSTASSIVDFMLQ